MFVFPFSGAEMSGLVILTVSLSHLTSWTTFVICETVIKVPMIHEVKAKKLLSHEIVFIIVTIRLKQFLRQNPQSQQHSAVKLEVYVQKIFNKILLLAFVFFRKSKSK